MNWIFLLGCKDSLQRRLSGLLGAVVSVWAEQDISLAKTGVHGATLARHDHAGNALTRCFLFQICSCPSSVLHWFCKHCLLMGKAPRQQPGEALVLSGMKSRNREDLSRKVFHCPHALPRAGSPSEIQPMCLLWLSQLLTFGSTLGWLEYKLAISKLMYNVNLNKHFLVLLLSLLLPSKLCARKRCWPEGLFGCDQGLSRERKFSRKGGIRYPHFICVNSQALVGNISIFRGGNGLASIEPCK